MRAPSWSGASPGGGHLFSCAHGDGTPGGWLPRASRYYNVMRAAERRRRAEMAKFVIAPHMRLHEWVAEEKGYFKAEGLDYEFHEALSSAEGKNHNLGDKVGAYQT